MKWTKADRFNTCISVINSFMIEYKAVTDFAVRQGIDHNELWRGYCEQRKEIMAENWLKVKEER